MLIHWVCYLNYSGFSNEEFIVVWRQHPAFEIFRGVLLRNLFIRCSVWARVFICAMPATNVFRCFWICNHISGGFKRYRISSKKTCTTILHIRRVPHQFLTSRFLRFFQSTLCIFRFSVTNITLGTLNLDMT